MSIATILLGIAGYGLYNDKTDINRPLDRPEIVEGKIQFHRKKKETKTLGGNLLSYVKYLYGAFVFYCIMYPMINITCEYINDDNINKMNINLFNVLLFIQNIYGIHFCNITNFINNIQNNKTKERFITRIIIVIYIIAIIVTIVYVVLIKQLVIMYNICNIDTLNKSKILQTNDPCNFKIFNATAHSE